MFYERPGKKGVEESKQNLQKVIEAKKFSKHALMIQKAFRRFLAKQKVATLYKGTIMSKLQDLNKLKQMLGDKLKVLPLKHLVQLIRNCNTAQDPSLVTGLKDWIDQSLQSEDNNVNFMSNSDNWNLFVYIAVSYCKVYPTQKELDRYILNLLYNCKKIGSFFRFLLFMQLTNDYQLLRTVKKYLAREILLSSDNVLNKSIQNSLEFIVLANNLYYEIEINSLKPDDRCMVYEGFVEIQSFIVEEILSVPRIAKFLLQFHLFSQVKWKEMIQSYYYGKLVVRNSFSGYIENEIFLFGNLWEIFQAKLFVTMTPSDLAHFLAACTKLVRNLSPSVLECSSNASITEPLNLKNLRKQIALFTDSGKLTEVFLKIFGKGENFDDDFNEVAALSLCEIYNCFLTRCQDSKEAQFVITGIMGGLAFNKKIISKIWKFLNSFCGLNAFLTPGTQVDPQSNFYRYSSVLSIFCSAFNTLLLISNDQEFPHILSLKELESFTIFLISFTKSFIVQARSDELVESLLKSVTTLLKLIHEFNHRLNFLPEEKFHFDKRTLVVIAENRELENRVLHYFPFLLPFEERAEILISKIIECKGPHSMMPAARIVVRRDSLMADTIAQLIHVPDIRGRLEVRFINVFGTEEDGFDAGGLFKEFWTSLSQEAFSPQYGLFSFTKDHCLYPNPDSNIFFGRDHLEMFYLVGRIIGKAIFERITIEPQFTEFFLRKMVGKYNFVEDLKSMDLELYNNLMFLKNFEGNCEDLALNFIVSNTDGSQFELKPKGAEIVVNNQNKLEYIYKLADYRLNLQIKNQCSAFFRGFCELIPISWVSCFTPKEMQRLISGTTEEIDLKDLMNHTKYVDCFSFDKVVKDFWKVMESFNNEERKMVLKFVTSCQRSPLMGFKNLHPPFTISKQTIDRDDEKLPTAQTCMNILRVPTYSGWKVMREKFLIAIKSGAGFEFR